jgi:hypothetical protein
VPPSCGKVALADATSISFSAPLIVAALFGPALGERVTRLQWLAIVTGFAGAILIIRPTCGDTSLWALLILGSAFCYAGYQILTRTVAGVDPPQTSVLYSALAGGVVLSAMVPFFWRTPSGWLQWLLFASLGLIGRDLALPLRTAHLGLARRLCHLRARPRNLDLAGRRDDHRQRSLHRPPRGLDAGAPRGREAARRLTNQPTAV